MLTNMKFENRPVHLFNIAGRKYYVARSSAPQTGAVALSFANEGGTDLPNPLNARSAIPEREKNARGKSPLDVEQTGRSFLIEQRMNKGQTVNEQRENPNFQKP